MLQPIWLLLCAATPSRLQVFLKRANQRINLAFIRRSSRHAAGMSKKKKKQVFWKEAGRILNAGQTRTVVLTGNIYDLFRLEAKDQPVRYAPMFDVLATKWAVPSAIVISYELTGPLRFFGERAREKMREAWITWRTGLDSNERAIKKMLATQKAQAEFEYVGKEFDANLTKAIGNPTLALAMLKQMCVCSRSTNGLKENLIIILESADMILPENPIPRLSDNDRKRIAVCQDWFSDPEFAAGRDSVILIAESRSMLHRRVGQLPQVLEVEVHPPDDDDRREFIDWFEDQQDKKIDTWGSKKELTELTAGLSLHALNQMLKGTRYRGEALTQSEVVVKVEEFIKSQLGEDIIEFKKPSHYLKDVVGFKDLKQFLVEELMPRFKSTGKDALPGAAVCGPIGGGKTFIFEAVAAELDMVVLVLKNIRSQWFGETDVIFERLRRTLTALTKVLIFVDEADTQFGGVGKEAHSTERRLTGKIQAMMSDPRLRGRVLWLLMTARIHLLSPDIRRPGRVGDLIIPILDPMGDDRDDFIRWVVGPVLEGALDEETFERIRVATDGFFAASYAALRSELKAKAIHRQLTVDDILAIIENQIPPAIELTRKYQKLQALINCTRRNLLPDPSVTAEDRAAWLQEIKRLEALGVE